MSLFIAIEAAASSPRVAVTQLLGLLESLAWKQDGAQAVKETLQKARELDTEEAALAALTVVLGAAAGWSHQRPKGHRPIDTFWQALRSQVEAGATQPRADA